MPPCGITSSSFFFSSSGCHGRYHCVPTIQRQQFFSLPISSGRPRPTPVSFRFVGNSCPVGCDPSDIRLLTYPSDFNRHHLALRSSLPFLSPFYLEQTEFPQTKQYVSSLDRWLSSVYQVVSMTLSGADPRFPLNCARPFLISRIVCREATMFMVEPSRELSSLCTKLAASLGEFLAFPARIGSDLTPTWQPKGFLYLSLSSPVFIHFVPNEITDGSGPLPSICFVLSSVPSLRLSTVNVSVVGI